MKSAGAAAEDAALDHLLAQGLRLTERNFRCRFGEIDIIMRDGDTVVFVEVRLRRSFAFGGAGESITAAKRHRILTAARFYISRLRTLPACRFDVVLMAADGPPCWIKNAFTE